MIKITPPARLLVCSLAFACAASLATAASDSVEQPPALQIVTLANQPWYEAEDKALAREIASPRNSKLKELSIAEIVIPAGVEVVPHHHVMEEVYYLLEGSGIMMVDGETTRVSAGQSVVIAPHQWHSIKNDSDQDIRMIVTCTPAWAPERLIFTHPSETAEHTH